MSKYTLNNNYKKPRLRTAPGSFILLQGKRTHGEVRSGDY